MINPKKNIFLSVIFPAYNEQERINETLKKTISFLSQKKYFWEIIVVDDGSTDNTTKVAQDIKAPNIYVIKHDENRGKGRAVRRGMLAAKGQYVLFSDSDLSTPIEEVDSLIFWLEKGYDVVCGSRALPQSRITIAQRWPRRLMGRIFNIFVQAIVLRGLRDTQCGFKCFRSETAKAVFSKQTLFGFAFDVEILFIARKRGNRIKEVGVRWNNSPCSKVNVFQDTIKMFFSLFCIRWRYWRGYYEEDNASKEVG